MLAEDLKEELAARLSPREEGVLLLRFGLDDGKPKTLDDVGRRLNVTRERVRQIQLRALQKLRAPSCASKLEGYLP